MDDFLTPEEASAVLKYSIGTLANWRVSGAGPRFHKQGRNIRYLLSDLRAWQHRNPCMSTSEAA